MLVLPVIETYKTKKPKLKKSRIIKVIISNLIDVAGEVFETKIESKKMINDTTKKKPNTIHVPSGIRVVVCCSTYISMPNNNA